mmetsp:Transcript_22997/g.69066  ORF Transcript_22997/g.69066 Transcript_22997/m.69066 type:complete len:267 (-) Transcript_22997:119-919(-)
MAKQKSQSSASGEAAPLIKAPSNGTWSPKPVLLAVVALAFVALTSGGGPATRLRSLRGPGKETSAETATLALSGQLPHCNSRVKPDGIAPGTIVGNCQQDGYPASSCQFYGTTDGDPTTDPCKELRCGKNRWYVCNADGPDDFCISYDVKGYHYEPGGPGYWPTCVRNGASREHCKTWDWDNAQCDTCDDGYTFDGNVCKYSRDNCENGIINPEGQKKGCYCCGGTGSCKKKNKDGAECYDTYTPKDGHCPTISSGPVQLSDRCWP